MRGSSRSTYPRPSRSRGSSGRSRRPTCPATTASARSSATRTSWPQASATTSASRSSRWRARRREAIRAAAAAVRIELEPLPAVLTIDEAIAGRHFIGPTRRIARGDAVAALERAEHVLEGTFRTGGQEHFYLETQAALAIPGESGQITVHSSTQHPSEVQEVVAHGLGLRQNQVVCVCNRMGGAFGGKESQAAHPAMLAALVAARAPGGRLGSSTRATSTCGSRASGIRICPATGSASTPRGGSTPSTSSCTRTPAARPTSRWP